MESKLRSSPRFFFSSTNLFRQYLRGSVSGVKSRSEVLVLLHGRLDAVEEEGVASAALEEEPAVPMKGGIAGLKVVFFLPLLPRPEMIEVMWLNFFSVKEGVKPEKRGFQPMRKKLGEKFGLVFSLTVVVTDTELFYYKARKKVENPYVNVVLPNGTCIEPSDVQRWLGFWLDRKLSWKHHIQTRTASAMRVFMALSRLGNTERGLSQSALQQLYQSCITTVADFGAEVWWNQQKIQSQPLQRLQNQAMRKIAGAFKTTPIAALEAELGLPPADLRLDRIQRAYATHLLTLPENHPVLELSPDTFPKTLNNERENGVPGIHTPWHEVNPFKHQYESRLTRILSYTNTILQPQSMVEEIDITATAPWDATNNIDIQIHPGNKDIAPHQHREKDFFTHANATHLCMYTDGSLLEGKTGAGIYASVTDEVIHESSYYLGMEAEVFDAELYSIMKATDIATKLSVDENFTDAWIFCDNQSAVPQMSNKRPLSGRENIQKTHRNAEILTSRGITTHIHWVPGHVNVKGNEQADIQAKEGTKGKRLPRDAPTSNTYLKRKVKEQQMHTWNARWPTMKRGHSYHGRPANNIHPLLRNHPSRKFVSTVIQMRTGHGYNCQYLARIPSSTIE